VRTVAAALALVAAAASATSPDLKVSSDDLNEAGEHFLEFQAQAPRQFLAEYSYGITDHWQIAFKLPADRGLRSLGSSVEVRYLGAHDREKGPYWGVDLAAGRARERRDEPWSSSVELQPVVGWRAGGWHFAVNPSLAFPTRGEDRRATFALQSKVARAFGGHELGLEHFLETGPLRERLPRSQQTEYLFLAWDKVGGNELNVALGRGLTDASARWIVKVVYSLQVFR
jgi:hypothetical protein